VLFFGSCALVCSIKKDENVWELSSLSLELWEKIYEKLFGGFEDLAATCAEDEEEEDELESIPASKKTKQGYLKDGFVVDSESSDDKEEYGSDEDDEEEEDESEEQEEVLEIEDIGSELSEEEYESSSEDDEA